jgi:hypothetical protein
VSMIAARWPGVLNTTVWFLHVGQVYSIQQYDSCTLSSWRKTHCRTAILLYWVHLANLPESYCCIEYTWPTTTVWFLHVGQVYSIQQYDSCTLARCTQYNSMILASWPGVPNTTVANVQQSCLQF